MRGIGWSICSVDITQRESEKIKCTCRFLTTTMTLIDDWSRSRTMNREEEGEREEEGVRVMVRAGKREVLMESPCN